MNKNKKKNTTNIHVNRVKPITPTQEHAFESWLDGNHLVMQGVAGSGKTFLALSFALHDIFSSRNERNRIFLMRSFVPTRDIGFLPGSIDEKSEAYEAPYIQLVDELVDIEGLLEGEAYNFLKDIGAITFLSTSYLRGMTLNNSVIIVDEFSNMNFHELDSVITRVGLNSRIIFCGDITQSDLTKTQEKNGILDFVNILRNVDEFDILEFGIDDIVRSGIVKKYLVEKAKCSM